MALTRLAITRRALYADGKAFGSAGAYEHLVGTAEFTVNPDHPRNADITDLNIAPRGEDGRVRFSADFALLQPIEASRGNGRLIFHVVNRGRKSLGPINDAPPEQGAAYDPDPGNGFSTGPRHGRPPRSF